MNPDRFWQSLVIVVSGLATIAAVAWLLLVDHAHRWPLIVGVVFVVATPAFIAYAYIRHDLQAERGRSLEAMRDAGYVLMEEKETPLRFLFGLVEVPCYHRYWEWQDLDGDGMIDADEVRELPRIVTVNGNRDKVPAGDLGYLACRRTLEWIYEQKAAGLPWSQRTGHRQLGAKLYDYGTAALAKMGLIGGRYERRRGTMRYRDFAAAARDLAEQWRNGGGYVSSDLVEADFAAPAAVQAGQSRRRTT